jgi:hypothetical protein
MSSHQFIHPHPLYNLSALHLQPTMNCLPQDIDSNKTVAPTGLAAMPPGNLATQEEIDHMETNNTTCFRTLRNVIDTRVLDEFFAFMVDIKETNMANEAYMAQFRETLVERRCRDQYTRESVEVWADTQIAFVTSMRERFRKVQRNFSVANAVPVTHDPAMAVDSLPISDADFLAAFLTALGDGTSVFDKVDSAALKRWENNVKPAGEVKIARRFLVCTLVCVLVFITDA